MKNGNVLMGLGAVVLQHSQFQQQHQFCYNQVNKGFKMKLSQWILKLDLNKVYEDELPVVWKRKDNNNDRNYELE